MRDRAPGLSASTADARYSRVAIAFHWTVAALVIANLALGILHEQFAQPARGLMMDTHKSIGVTVLVLSLARLAWRLGHRAPPLPPGTSRLEQGLAHGVHWTLYLFMILLPLTGWWMVSASGRPFPLRWFGLFPWPALPVGGTGTGPVAHDAHVVMGWAMLVLVIGHVGAALFHRFVRRDRVLRRMLPGAGPRHF